MSAGRTFGALVHRRSFSPQLPFRQAAAVHTRRTAYDRVGARPDKYKSNGSRHGRCRITVTPEEKQSGPRPCHAEPNQFTGVFRDGVHCYLQKFAVRLVEVLKA
jgi:hypothetical protein